MHINDVTGVTSDSVEIAAWWQPKLFPMRIRESENCMPAHNLVKNMVQTKSVERWQLQQFWVQCHRAEDCGKITEIQEEIRRQV